MADNFPWSLWLTCKWFPLHVYPLQWARGKITAAFNFRSSEWCHNKMTKWLIICYMEVTTIYNPILVIKPPHLLFVVRLLPIRLVLLNKGIACDQVAGDRRGFDPITSTPPSTLSRHIHGDQGRLETFLLRDERLHFGRKLHILRTRGEQQKSDRSKSKPYSCLRQGHGQKDEQIIT